MKLIRLAYPKQIRLYWIQDGLSSHWTPEIRAYADGNNIELVPTPTYASYLNRIESTFGAIDEFVCKNADYLDWDAFGHALADHVRYRNSPAERQRITRSLAGTGEMIVAQVHSHPRRAFHSPIDDEEAIPRRVGAYSLVVPDFGARDDLLDDAALFQLDAVGVWQPASLGTFRLPRRKGRVKWLIDILKSFGRSRT